MRCTFMLDASRGLSVKSLSVNTKPPESKQWVKQRSPNHNPSPYAVGHSAHARTLCTHACFTAALGSLQAVAARGPMWLGRCQVEQA